MYMLQDLNIDKIIQMKWIKGEDNSADIGTKNLDHASQTKETEVLCGSNFGARDGIARQQSRDSNTQKIVL